MSKKAKRALRSNPRADRNNVINLVPTNQVNLKRIDILPRNVSQEIFLDLLEDDNKDIIVASGPAGTGKTYLATLHAIKQMREGKYNKIVITRPVVPVDNQDLGFLPGSIIDKMSPWMKPIADVFMEYFDKKVFIKMLEEERVELAPIGFIRGRTFKNSIIILDESQGTSPTSLLSILTRIGEGSKMIITGDLNQADRYGVNGLADFLKRWNNTDEKSSRIGIAKFGLKDIERHPVVKDILDMYDSGSPIEKAQRMFQFNKSNVNDEIDDI